MMSFLTNRKQFVWLFGLILLFGIQMLYSESINDKINPYLQTKMKSVSPNDKIDVYIVLQDRLTLQDLQAQTQGLNRKTRQKEVARILKEFARVSQRNVLNFLETEQTADRVENIRSLWINNVVAFRSVESTIYQLAGQFNEIQRIFYDVSFPIEQLLDDNGITKYNKEHGLYSPTGPTGLQPGLTLINAPLVWAEGDSGQGILVANIDTGTDWKHPDLAQNVWNNLGEDADGDGHTMEWNGVTWIFDPGDVNNVDDDGNGKVDDFIGWDFDTNDNNPNDGGTHGTATSGIVVGNGTNGTQTGVAPRAKLMILKNNSGGESGYWLAQQYALNNGADVVTSSLSYKWYFSPQPNYPMFRQNTDMELAAGMVHTNSTSNDGNSVGVPFNISAPGNCPPAWLHPDQTLIGGLSSVIGSANVNASTDLIVSSSPYGPAAWEDFQINHPGYPYTMPPQYQDYPYETMPGSIGLIKPDVAAPGNGTTSTAPGGGYQSFGGTSGATPHLAGTAALILAANYDLDPADVSRIMQLTSVEKGAPGKDNRYGAGRVDAYAAYLQAFAEAGTPFAPAQLSAYSDYTTPTSMLLTWEDPTELLNGDTLLANDFHIHIERDGVWIDSVAGGSMQYTDTGLNDGQEYHYSVFAKVDSTHRMSAPVETFWIAGGSPVPNPPSQPGVSVEGNQLMFRWKNPVDNIDGTPMDDLAGVNLYQDSVLVTTFTRTSSDTGKIDSAIYTPPTLERKIYYLTVVDNETPQNESVPTTSIVTPMNAPVADAFSVAGDPNPVIWFNDDADINDRASNPPTGPLALNFNGKPDGGDLVELYQIDLSGKESEGVVLSYYYQPQGNGNAPETGDSLEVFFKNNLGNWVLVQAYPGTPLQPFQHEIIDVASAPNGGGTFFHSQFQIRLKSMGSPSTITPNDDWFVDDLFLGSPAPYIQTVTDTLSFDTTAVGNNSVLPLEIDNIGIDTLHVSGVMTTNAAFQVDSLPWTLAPGLTRTLNVTFAPAQTGDYSGWIQVVSDDPLRDTLNVFVTGVAIPPTGIGKNGLLPFTFAVKQNYPNPFNPTTTIKFQLPQASRTQLVIYNILGQKVRFLLNKKIEAGYHEVVWDGRNDLGHSVASGLYIYRFETEKYKKVMKMILMR